MLLRRSKESTNLLDSKKYLKKTFDIILRPDTLIIVMKTHTILFNIASRTCMKLSPKKEERVIGYIYNVMNGDGLYDNASKEIILEAYMDQERGGRPDVTWAHLIAEALDDIQGTGVLQEFRM